ncbi:MYXO-CTERM sorting domain-containing protein [Archangium primigenium]|uniref:MYXO-CTERM sorting domain-containing protein n=1 Tax=[Archangium] primigenium TaxID=2792470 RepID=UPI00195DC26A|nr:MYXO-CTERM sorting domain-containing protein [Archangium primigenium]MBM7114984.1 hypothetical protein [Archangium primigenium]
MRGRGWLGVLIWGVWLLGATALAATPLGEPCSLNSECGPAPAVCIDPEQRPSGSVAWVGGYCSRPCAAARDCPSGALCVSATVAGRAAAYCLKACAPEAAGQCRAQYVCGGVSTGGDACVPACSAERDCAAGFVCRACDKQCVPTQNPGVRIGQTCDTDAGCGTGEFCLFVNGNPQGVCSQRCGTEAGTCASACPNGSSCQKVGGDEALLCVRACEQGTCHPALQCAAFPEGARGCLPPCRAQEDCPAGSTCSASGQCVGPEPVDAGCPSCEGPRDAGTPPSPSPGGGTGPGTVMGPGCGCQGSAVNAPGFLGALAVLFVAARRRRCQRP